MFSLIKKDINKLFNSKDNIVLLTFDDGYFMQAINLMMTVKKFNNNVSFICICSGLTEHNADSIINNCFGLGVCLYQYKANFSLKSKRWKDVTCFRVFAPWLIDDATISEVLYLDADMLCKGSLQPIFGIKDYFLIMCNEVSGNTSNREELIEIYCNAGLAKINLEAFRKGYDYDSISKLFFSNLDSLPYLDQDFLNFYLGNDKVKKINGLRYNLQPYELFGSLLYESAINNCRMIHFSCFRPWDREGCTNIEYYDLYIKYSLYQPLIDLVKHERKRFKQFTIFRLLHKLRGKNKK